MTGLAWQTAAILLLGGVAAGYLLHLAVAARSLFNARRLAARQLKDARRDAAAIRKEAEIQARAATLQARDALERSMAERREVLLEQEERLLLREQSLDRKLAALDKKEGLLDNRLQRVEEDADAAAAHRVELETLVVEERERLARAAGLSVDDARGALLRSVESDVRAETGALARRLLAETEANAQQEARRVVITAIQRYAAAHAGDVVTNSVLLPNDEMKARIVGRNGRNIRVLEAETGVTFLVDDIPDRVIVSSFDPQRREIAREALHRLILDGRIHPARIEEVVREVRGELDSMVHKAGEDAADAAGVRGAAPELLAVLGRLKFRMSYGQNVLSHSVEVAHLAAAMAGELRLDPRIARRAGLFHDLGKAVDHEVDGPHAVVGSSLLRRHGEEEIVVNAVAAHHGDVEAHSVYAALVAAADAISGSRPGARVVAPTQHIERLSQLEAVANAFPGVTDSYAIQAGREVRVIVRPDEVSDDACVALARDIARRIEADVQYAGQIRVIVVRETRVIEYAR